MMTQRRVSALALAMTILFGLGILVVRDQFFTQDQVKGQEPTALVQTSDIRTSDNSATTSNSQGLFGSTSATLAGLATETTGGVSGDTTLGGGSTGSATHRVLETQSSSTSYQSDSYDDEHDGDHHDDHDDDHDDGHDDDDHDD